MLAAVQISNLPSSKETARHFLNELRVPDCQNLLEYQVFYLENHYNGKEARANYDMSMSKQP